MSVQTKKMVDGIQYSESDNYAIEHVANLIERSIQDSSEVPETFEKPYNTDDLYSKTSDYSIYFDMLKDDQVKAVSQLKKDILLGSGFEILPGEEGQEDIVEDLMAALTEDLEVPFEDCLEEIKSDQDFGFSISEKIFKKRNDGSLTLKAIKTRHPGTWEIRQDGRGNVTEYIQKAITGDIKINANSLIHMVNNKLFQNPYGTSDLRAAHTAWFIKVQIVKFYAIFLEKSASPTPVASFDKKVSKEAVDKIHAAIEKFQVKTALTIPNDIELEFIEAKSNGEVYEKAINMFNMFIGRALLVPDLLGFAGAETNGGSFSLGENQMDVFFKHINRRQKTLEHVINQQIIKPLVVFNHGFIDKWPKFKFKPIKDADATELAKTWIEAVKSKTYQPSDEEINHFRGLVKFPEGEVERVEPPPNPFDPGAPEAEKNPDGKGKDPIEEEEKSNFSFKNPEGDFHKRVDFKAIGTQLDAAFDNLTAQSRELLDDIFSRLISDIEKKKIMTNPDRVSQLSLTKKKDLNLLFKRSFKEHFDKNRILAQEELFKSDFKAIDISEDFLEFLDKETFEFVGDWEYDITKRARVELNRAIRDGEPLSSVVDFINEDTRRGAEVSLERFARTKFTDVMNHSRQEFFNKSGIVSGYQYSAIMDGRTTVICGGLHGKKFKAGTEPIPPLHFSCRSVLIPITKFEEFKPDTRVGGTVQTARGDDIKIPGKDINKHIEDNIGRGFSIK